MKLERKLKRDRNGTVTFGKGNGRERNGREKELQYFSSRRPFHLYVILYGIKRRYKERYISIWD